MFPISIGSANVSILFHGVPTVMSVGALIFLNTSYHLILHYITTSPKNQPPFFEKKGGKETSIHDFPLFINSKEIIYYSLSSKEAKKLLYIGL